VGKEGLVGFSLCFASHNVVVYRDGAPVVLNVDLSLHLLVGFNGVGGNRFGGDGFGVDHLAVADIDHLTRFPFHRFKPRNAHHILPQVVHIGAFYRFGNRFGHQGNVVSDGDTHIALNLYIRCRLLVAGGSGPAAVVETAQGPVVDLFACIVLFAKLETITGYRPFVVAFPRGVGDQNLFGAILKGDYRFGQQTLADAVLVDPTGGEDVQIAEPACTQHGTEAIGPLFEQRGNVVAVIHYPVAIVGPAGIEIVVAHALAVDVEFVDAPGSYIETGRFYRFGKLQALAQHGGGNMSIRLPNG